MALRRIARLYSRFFYADKSKFHLGVGFTTGAIAAVGSATDRFRPETLPKLVGYIALSTAVGFAVGTTASAVLMPAVYLAPITVPAIAIAYARK